MMVEVRIRAASEAKSAHLCMWPATDMETLRREVASWGVLSQNGDMTSDVSGMFVAVDGQAYFELVAGDDD